jgi:hypothetical protein
MSSEVVFDDFSDLATLIGVKWNLTGTDLANVANLHFDSKCKRYDPSPFDGVHWRTDMLQFGIWPEEDYAKLNIHGVNYYVLFKQPIRVFGSEKYTYDNSTQTGSSDFAIQYRIRVKTDTFQSIHENINVNVSLSLNSISFIMIINSTVVM